MKAYFGTNVGQIREKNEDDYVLLENERYFLCAVADGMGGYKAGEIASEIVVTTVGKHFMDYTDGIVSDVKIPMMISESIKLANKLVLKESSLNEEFSGMGSTITLAVIDKKDKVAYVGNVGDSRTYLIRGNIIKQITDDHSFVRELVKKGELTAVEAETYDKKNIITRALGSEENVREDIFEIDLHANDRLLLCSDGLTNNVDENCILREITNSSKNSIKNLIDIANRNGGTDNITLIVLDC